MGIRRNGNTPTPDPVTFPDGRTTLVFGVIAVGGKGTRADATYTIATPRVTFADGSTTAQVRDEPVSQNGTKISLPVRFRVEGPGSPPNVIEVTASVNEVKQAEEFRVAWSIAVMHTELAKAMESMEVAAGGAASTAAAAAAAAATAAVAMMVPHIIELVDRHLADARPAPKRKKPKGR